LQCLRGSPESTPRNRVVSSAAVPIRPAPLPRLLSLAACLAALAAGVQAAPEQSAPATDPVMALLAERKLLMPLEGSQVIQAMRDKASEAVISAMNFLGVPYRRGGNTEASGFDCSGFTRHIFENSLGLVLPRRADEQASLSSLLPIQREDLKPGDLVFFNTMKRTFSHVGIYVGDDKFIHSPRTGAAVRIEDMRESYWARRFTGARRADLGAAAPSPR
jgi:cell wall-associated NlpC family hydrolase